MHRSMASRPICFPAPHHLHRPRPTITRRFVNASVIYNTRQYYSLRARSAAARAEHQSHRVPRPQRTGAVPNIARLENNGPACVVGTQNIKYICCDCELIQYCYVRRCALYDTPDYRNVRKSRKIL